MCEIVYIIYVHVHLVQTFLFQNFLNSEDVFSFRPPVLIIFSGYNPIKHIMAARKEIQETAEYYQWLIQMEHQEFEAELLEIVSI